MLIDFIKFQDTACLADVIKKTNRPSPYIVKIGSSFNVIADGQPYIYVSSSSMEALLCLVCTYFVYNMVYCKQVVPTLLFLQTEVLAQKNNCTSKNVVLRNFVLQLRDVD